MSGVLLAQGGRLETETQQRSYVMMEAEIGWMWPRAKGHLDHTEAGRGKKDAPQPRPDLSFRFSPPGLVRG